MEGESATTGLRGCACLCTTPPLKPRATSCGSNRFFSIHDRSDSRSRGMAMLLLFALLLLLLAAVSCRRYDTWHRKRVPYDTPLPVFGSCLRTLVQWEPLYLTLDRIYRRFPGRALVGFYSGPTPVLLVKSTAIIKDITVKNFDTFTNHKLSPSPQVDKMFSKFLFCLKDDLWKSTRVKMTSSFSTGRLKSMYPNVKAVGKQFVATIRQSLGGSSGEVELHGLCTRYGVDVIGSCAFGCEAGALRDPSGSAYMRAVAEAFRFGILEGLSCFLIMFVPVVYHILRLPLMPDWRADILRNLLRQATEHREREPEQSAKRDIFDGLLQLKRDGDVSDDIFEGQVAAMQVAGSESSATTVMFALWELARSPAMQQRLREELQAAAKADGGELTYETMHDLRYLDMVFKETMRLWPVMPWLDRVCSEDYEVPGTGVKLERGTLVIIPVYSIQRDPELHCDPETFNPERFSDRSSDKSAFLPFGSGPRACIGSRFADMSVKSALCNLLLNFRVSLPASGPQSPSDLGFSSSSFLIHLKHELKLRFESIN